MLQAALSYHTVKLQVCEIWRHLVARLCITKIKYLEKGCFYAKSPSSRCLWLLFQCWCTCFPVNLLPFSWNDPDAFSHRLSLKGLFLRCAGKRWGIQEETFQDVQPPLLPARLSRICHQKPLMCRTCSRCPCLSSRRSPHHVRRPPTMSRWVW